MCHAPIVGKGLSCFSLCELVENPSLKIRKYGAKGLLNLIDFIIAGIGSICRLSSATYCLITVARLTTTTRRGRKLVANRWWTRCRLPKAPFYASTSWENRTRSADVTTHYALHVFLVLQTRLTCESHSSMLYPVISNPLVKTGLASGNRV